MPTWMLKLSRRSSSAWSSSTAMPRGFTSGSTNAHCGSTPRFNRNPDSPLAVLMPVARPRSTFEGGSLSSRRLCDCGVAGSSCVRLLRMGSFCGIRSCRPLLGDEIVNDRQAVDVSTGHTDVVDRVFAVDDQRRYALQAIHPSLGIGLLHLAAHAE